jgi:predicted DNA-binding protein
MTTTTFSVRVGRSTKSRLEKLAKNTCRSRSFLAAEAISAYLENHPAGRAYLDVVARMPTDEDMVFRAGGGRLAVVPFSSQTRIRKPSKLIRKRF